MLAAMADATTAIVTSLTPARMSVKVLGDVVASELLGGVTEAVVSTEDSELTEAVTRRSSLSSVPKKGQRTLNRINSDQIINSAVVLSPDDSSMLETEMLKPNWG